MPLCTNVSRQQILSGTGVTPAEQHDERSIAELPVDASRKEPADRVLPERIDQGSHGVVVHDELPRIFWVNNVRAREEVRREREVLVCVRDRVVQRVGMEGGRRRAAADVGAGPAPRHRAVRVPAREEVRQEHADADIDEGHDKDLKDAACVGGLDDGGAPPRDREVELCEGNRKRTADDAEQRRRDDGEDVGIHLNADLEGDVAAEEAKVTGVVDGAVKAVQEVLHRRK